MLTLRKYQSDLLSEVLMAMKKHRHLIVQLGTGGGKTLIFSEIARRSSLKGSRILILSDRTELLSQSDTSLRNLGVTAEFISPKHTKVPASSVVVAMNQTLKRRYLKKEWAEYIKSVDLIIIDECHISETEYLFESGLISKAWVLGFSATPIRSGHQRQLGLDYSAIVVGESTKNLIKQGYLVPARYFTIDAPDLSKVEVDRKDGDYKSSQLSALFSTPDRFSGLVSQYKKICPNAQAICFCASQANAIQTCIELNNAGISAKFLISGFSKDDENYQLLQDNLKYTGKRADVIAGYKSGDFKVLVNAKILTTGFDAPNTQAIILYSATLSMALYRQMLGRGSRPFGDKKDFFCLDFGGNVKRHGRYEDSIGWHLWHDDSGGNGVVMTKECPKDKKDKEGKTGCGRLIPISAQFCPFCRYIFATEKEIRDAELVEIIDGKFKFKDMSALQLKAYAELHGNKMAWVYRMLYVGGGEAGLRKGLKELGYSGKFIWLTLERFKKEKKIN